MTCTIRDLKTDAVLNGMQAKLDNYLPAVGRWVVTIVGQSGDPRKIRPVNLQPPPSSQTVPENMGEAHPTADTPPTIEAHPIVEAHPNVEALPAVRNSS